MATSVNTRRTYNAAFRREQAHVTRRRVLDAARRLFAARGYPAVTIGDVAAEAGVAVQTVHAIFGAKLGLAQGIVEAALEDVQQEALTFIHQADQAQDLEVTLRTVAAIARAVYERFADVMLFLRGAGDPQLTAEAERFDRLRRASQAPIAPALAIAGALRSGLDAAEAADLIWALSSPEWYELLVRRRGWTPERWQTVVGDTLVRALLA